MSRLFVGGLSFTTEEEGLRTAFSKFGEVVDARIVTDRETGRSRGFGFVTYLSEADSETAMNKMSGQFLDGRVIRVDRASPRPAPPRFNNPVSDAPEQPVSQDWGSIPSPIASVPQNAGLAQTAGPTPGPTSSDSASFGAASGLPDLSTLASPNNTTASGGPFNFGTSDSSPPTKASTKDTGPSFDFIDLDLSNLPPPDPNRLPRRRPPRIRPSSMADYEFGYYMSETSKFPFNTNFETGFSKSKGPDFEFDFSDIKEAAAIKKAKELAIRQAKEAEEAAIKQAQEAEEAATKQAQEAATAAADPTQTASEAGGSPQSALQTDKTPQAELSSQAQEPGQAISPDLGQASSAEFPQAAAPELQQAAAPELQQAA